VAALLVHMLNTEPALRRSLRHCPAIRCIAIAPPAVACPALAAAMRPYVTSVIKQHDIIAHCSLAQVAKLRREVLATDWYQEWRVSVLEMAYIRVRVVFVAGVVWAWEFGVGSRFEGSCLCHTVLPPFDHI